MSLNLNALRDVPPDELSRRMRGAWDEVTAEHTAALRAPISFRGCDPKMSVYLMSIQHGVGENSLLISTDGDPANIKRVPLLSKAKKKPITVLYHSQVEWTPDRLGFQIYRIPGWLASDREFAQARSPQLSSEIDWTDAEREAWAQMRKRWVLTPSAGYRGPPRPGPVMTRAQAY